MDAAGFLCRGVCAPGDEVRLSTASSEASSVMKPCILRSKSLKALYQAVDHKGRQHLVQRGADAVAHVVALVETRRGTALEEVDEPLRRGVDASAGGLESAGLDPALELQQAQRTLGTDVLGAHRHGDAAVGEGRIARRIAHAVHHLLPSGRGGRHNDAAGAHAEGEHSVSTHLGDKAVGGRRQEPGIALAVILNLVDELLRVLHAHAEGEGLGLEQPAAAGKELVDVAGRMACGEDHGVALDDTASVDDHPADAALLDLEVDNARIEMILAAMLHNRLPHAGDDGGQAVGADMGVDVDHDVGVGAMLHEELQHLADVAALGGARVELAVAVGPCAALAEAPVAVGVHLLGAHHADDVGLALLHGLAALDDDGLHAQLQRPQGCEEARGAGTDDDNVFWGCKNTKEKIPFLG